MIGRLTGTIVETSHEFVVLDVGGVGYLIAITPRTMADLPGIGEEVVLHTHLHVREDQLALFGFDSAAGSDSAGDFDGDGYTNLEEFLNGTDPNVPQAGCTLSAKTFLAL